MAVTTMRDIAKKAGVSQTTVSFVLNDRQNAFISEETSNRVRAAAQELCYRPNHSARALARGKTDTIGLWVKSLHSSYYIQFLQDVDRIVTEAGYSLIINRNTALLEASSIMQTFPMQSVDGIIAVDIPETVDHFTQNLSAFSPLVNIGSQYSKNVDYVASEIMTGTNEAIRHLIGRGKRAIALLIDTPSHGIGGGERETAYLSTMRDAGLEPEIIEVRSQSHEDALEAVSQRVRGGRSLEALFCYNDDMALGAGRALHDACLRIPEDVALIGCDDIAEARFLEPPLSTIKVPRTELCVLAWEFLKNRMQNPDLPLQSATMSSHFIPRASS